MLNQIGTIHSWGYPILTKYIQNVSHKPIYFKFPILVCCQTTNLNLSENNKIENINMIQF